MKFTTALLNFAHGLKSSGMSWSSALKKAIRIMRNGGLKIRKALNFAVGMIIKSGGSFSASQIVKMTGASMEEVTQYILIKSREIKMNKFGRFVKATRKSIVNHSASYVPADFTK